MLDYERLCLVLSLREPLKGSCLADAFVQLLTPLQTCGALDFELVQVPSLGIFPATCQELLYGSFLPHRDVFIEVSAVTSKTTDGQRDAWWHCDAPELEDIARYCDAVQLGPICPNSSRRVGLPLLGCLRSSDKLGVQINLVYISVCHLFHNHLQETDPFLVPACHFGSDLVRSKHRYLRQECVVSS